MGYMTTFKMTAELVVGKQTVELVDNAPLLEAIKDFRATNANAEYAIEDDGSTREQTKWYEYADELVQFSKKYPNILFTLDGEGEESGDIWSLYVLNGRSQLAKAVVQVAPVNLAELVK